MNIVNGWSVGGILFVYYFIRAWSYFVSRKMLRTILRSSAGKKSHRYVQKATCIQHFYGIYIPKVTSYRHKLSQYLALNNVVCACCSGIITTLAVISAFFSNGVKCILECFSMFTVLFLCIPTIIISFIQTSWNGGHPHYCFDLEADFISASAKVHRKLLLDEKRNSILLSPEEFNTKTR